MDILKIATEWAKDEVFSTRFFILFGFIFVLATIGFWQLGKTEYAKSFVYPTLIAGALLLTIGFGLFFTNKYRITQFEKAYHENPVTFVASELERVDSTLAEYKSVVFKAIPMIMVIASLLIVFVDKPHWRAGSIIAIAMLIVILIIDSNAHARISNYHSHLIEAQQLLTK